MAGIGVVWSDAELSTDRRTGIITGDADPSTTQKGVFPKFAKATANLHSDYADLKSAFDAHDHSNYGQPLGTGGARSFVAGAIIHEKIATATPAVSGPKIQDGAIGTGPIKDQNVTDAKLGDAAAHNLGVIGASAFVDWTPVPPCTYPLFHIEGTDSGNIAVTGYGTGTIRFTNTQPSPTADPIVVVYRGGGN